jgi:hypothetical protein
VHLGDVRQVELVLGAELLEVGDVLKEVGIKLLLGQLQIGLDVVVELDDLEFDALFLQLSSGDGQDLSVRNGGGADDEGLLPTDAAGESQGQCDHGAEERGNRALHGWDLL